jgi:hypothetical protein
LAGESACDDIDAASPRAPVEGAHVIEKREPGKVTVFLPLRKDLEAMEITLDCPDGDVSEELVGKNPAASSCK